MAKKLELKEKDAKELTQLLAEKREELRKARFGALTRSASGNAKDIRADIARILTELSARSAA